MQIGRCHLSGLIANGIVEIVDAAEAGRRRIDEAAIGLELDGPARRSHESPRNRRNRSVRVAVIDEDVADDLRHELAAGMIIDRHRWLIGCPRINGDRVVGGRIVAGGTNCDDRLGHGIRRAIALGIALAFRHHCCRVADTGRQFEDGCGNRIRAVRRANWGIARVRRCQLAATCLNRDRQFQSVMMGRWVRRNVAGARAEVAAAAAGARASIVELGHRIVGFGAICRVKMCRCDGGLVEGQSGHRSGAEMQRHQIGSSCGGRGDLSGYECFARRLFRWFVAIVQRQLRQGVHLCADTGFCLGQPLAPNSSCRTARSPTADH